MKVTKHINYFESLLLLGGKIRAPFAMTPGQERAKGRVWMASAVIQLGMRQFTLQAKFHGNKTETEEVAKANLIIEVIVDIATNKEYKRPSGGILTLNTGIYVPTEPPSPAVVREIREICAYDSSLYMGMPSEAEAKRIRELKYLPIVIW